MIVGSEENTGVGFGSGNRILDPQAASLRVNGAHRTMRLADQYQDRLLPQGAANGGNRRLEKTRGSDFSRRLLFRFAGYVGQRTGHTERRNLRIEPIEHRLSGKDFRKFSIWSAAPQVFVITG